ncbi:MAG: 2-C-methyl-D-erythritol 4-phosphate cytidylyltransferase, partial [Polaromonas sp.]|nr:2-C-methyl-D-erythritol 4-phosphate cytidylyltransferase [Polaromonas sp.]
GEPVTDEASAMEAAGVAPQLVRGSAHNFKVTYPEDFLLAEALIKSRTPAKPRVRKPAAPKAAQKVLSDDSSTEPS